MPDRAPKPQKNVLQEPVQLAVIGAAHGMSGALRVNSFTADPLALGDYGPLMTGDGRVLTVANVKPAGNVVVASFREVSDRTAAEALNGVALFVERSALPADLEEEEYYHADLIGLELRDETGNMLGKIVAIEDFGAGDILTARLVSGAEAMVPFTRAAVPTIDLAAGFVRIDSIAAGLVDVPEEADNASDGAERPG